MPVWRLHRLGAALCAVIVMGVPCGVAAGDPIFDNYGAPVPLPVFAPTPSDWQPQYPGTFADLRRYVTTADVDATREMCQWFEAQYLELRRQIDRLNNTIVTHNGDFAAPGVTQQVDTVVANIDHSVAFLTPRATALTQSHDHAGDMYFPIYQGDAFYGLWQQLSNVGNGLRARQPTWFSGPSVMRAKHWGSKIDRSHVCR